MRERLYFEEVARCQEYLFNECELLTVLIRRDVFTWHEDEKPAYMWIHLASRAIIHTRENDL